MDDKPDSNVVSLKDVRSAKELEAFLEEAKKHRIDPAIDLRRVEKIDCFLHAGDRDGKISIGLVIHDVSSEVAHAVGALRFRDDQWEEIKAKVDMFFASHRKFMEHLENKPAG